MEMTTDPQGLDELLARHPPQMVELVQGLRTLIRRTFPQAEERVDLSNGLLAYGVSMKMRDLAFAIVPHKSHVNVQFADGADLPDPAGLMEGTGKRIRHVKVRQPADIDRAELLELIREQARRKS